MQRFAAEHGVWQAALEAVAELDALMSLAHAADMGTAAGPMCRPRLVPAGVDGCQVSSKLQAVLLVFPWPVAGTHHLKGSVNTTTGDAQEHLPTCMQDMGARCLSGSFQPLQIWGLKADAGHEHRKG